MVCKCAVIINNMEKFTIGKLTASVILDKRRAKENSLYPVKHRIVLDRKAYYYPCMDLSVEEWDSISITRKKELIQKREIIQADFKRITDIIVELSNGVGFSIEGLNKRLSRGSKDSVIDAFDYKIADLEKSNQLGTASAYSCAKVSIGKYIKRDIKFSDITPDWLRKYEAHLIGEGKAYTSISMYMRALRSIINDAKTAGVITASQYPFLANNNGKYSIPEGSGRKISLTKEQLIAVFNYPILPENEKWRDLWIFSFYCNGINLNDLLRLKYKNIEDGEIVWYRAKTIKTDKNKKKIRAHITEEMQAILDRYSNPDKEADNYIFPYLNRAKTPIEQRMIVQNVTHTINKKMKAIGDALGIDNLTTYVARHSYATILKRMGANLASISESMGHSNLKTTEAYFDSFGKEERIKNSNMLPKRNKL